MKGSTVKIIDVRTRFFAFTPDKPVVNSFGSMERRTMCLVEVLAEDGTIGVGESWVNFPSWSPSERKATIEMGIRPLLLGEDATDVVGLHSLMISKLKRTALQWGSIGAVYQAISGVDLALWDLKGKVVGLPVYQMLGRGVGVTKIPVYASGLGPQVSDDDIRRQKSLGINSFKLKVGFGDEIDLSRLDKLRGIVGQEAKIMVDANQAWTTQRAIKMLAAMSSCGVDWAEEPLQADDLEGYITLGARSEIPIAAGENMYGRRSFAEWGSRHAIGIAQPDVTKVGGLTEGLVIANMMSSWNIPFAPHFLGSIVGLVATCHLFAAVPGGLIVELDSNDNPLRDKLVTPGLEIVDGNIILSGNPGWGLELDEDVLAKYEL